MLRGIQIIGWLLLSSAFLAQGPDYHPPMDIEFRLSGNFGEMRRNHFHTGLDIKTQGRVGIPVYSIEDGYVSRIKVSPYGYGRAIYIDHPSTGHTSVYAHLSAFSDTLEYAMKRHQYMEEEWATDFYPEPGEWPVLRGELIGRSGNSGSSTGPHLHFEVRDTETERPLNPLLFGFAVEDDVFPVFKGLRLYELDQASKWSAEVYKTIPVKVGKGGAYVVEDVVKVSGEVGIALMAQDYMSNTGSRFGLYELEMKVDGITHYLHRMDTLDFSTFRQVNCHMDYHSYLGQGQRWQRCFPAEGHSLTIYKQLVREGLLQVLPGARHRIELLARDFHGQDRSLSFELIGEEMEAASTGMQDAGQLLDASTDNLVRIRGFVLRIPKGRIYEDYVVRPSEVDSPKGALSKGYKLKGPHIPLDSEVVVRIRPTDTSAVDRPVILQWKDHRGISRNAAGRWKNGWYEAKVKELGTFYLWPDEKKPEMTEIRLPSAKRSKLNLKFRDLGGAGVDSLRVEVDGRWLRVAHNASMSRAWGDIEELELAPGKHELKVILQDLAGNEAIFERTFER